MSPLPSELRNLLDRAVGTARDAAESAARSAMTALAVVEERPEFLRPLSAEDRALRVLLREKARQLANTELRGAEAVQAGFEALAQEVAYEQWHRMLFARFLAENGLLRHPDGIAVTLADCAELAVEEGEGDAWTLAARYASAMLPGIFKTSDPVVQVRFAPEGNQALERILTALPATVFTADDALGWVYQFWQTKKKKEVNESGRKIGGADLAPVTQLFTEHYMVAFLLENSLGAWWAARHPDSPLLQDFTYLRYKDDGTPAACAFPGWPERAVDVTVMDPCCGSGHFLVEAFAMLRHMRMEEGGLGEVAAADAVLRDNLFGLEIDPRCTQIAAFALALAAWKAGGYRQLPVPNIACSGIPVRGQWETWQKLAEGDSRLENTLKRLYELFTKAPDLGSLINPADVPGQPNMFEADSAEVETLLTKALAEEHAGDDPAAAVFGDAAVGVAQAADLLARKYTLVTTNVPYLVRGKQNRNLQDFCEAHYPDARTDLATCVLRRCQSFLAPAGSCCAVTPQGWLYLGSYRSLRQHLLNVYQWQVLARLGSGAFETISGEVVKPVLLVITNALPANSNLVYFSDIAGTEGVASKDAMLRATPLTSFHQERLLRNPDAVITLLPPKDGILLSTIAKSAHGIGTFDKARFIFRVWEVTDLAPTWLLSQSTVERTELYGGRQSVLRWESGTGELAKYILEMKANGYTSGKWKAGQQIWGHTGILISLMSNLPVSLYTGEPFDENAAAIVPNDPSHVPALWAFCSSSQFNVSVRNIDQSLKVTPATVVKVPIDLAHWQAVAAVAGPLPEPYSNDPTQWLFKGHPADSTEPLQVAVARLLGYRWPEQADDGLDAYAIADGIACLSVVAGQPQAVERLRTLLATAYGTEWSPRRQEELLAAAQFGGKGLDAWLRDGFFAQHCKLFHNRPFIWQIWDGRKDGFSALVNYHTLDAARLNALIYSYLGQWIEGQRRGVADGVAGDDGRLVAALRLQEKLHAIQTGEPPYDIYVRWKPDGEQPIGWQPDLNDGVRLNVRPFVTAGVLRDRFTISWNKDRGHNPDGSERVNDVHLTIPQKQKAREVGPRGGRYTVAR